MRYYKFVPADGRFAFYRNPGEGLTEIDDADHAALFAAQAQGSVIAPDANGHPVAVDPKTLMTLAQVQAAQIGELAQAYATAIAQPVSFKSAGGVSKTYQADPDSVGKLQNMLLAFAGAQATPTGFYWIALDNTQVPFTFADLQGLAAAMGAQGFAAFEHLQARKAAVNAAATSAAALSVIW